MARRRAARPDAHAAVAALARELAALLRELDLGEIDARVGDVRVSVRRAPPPPVLAPPPTLAPAPAAPSPGTATGAGATPATITIEAPMVGTFYRASAPTAEPYVREGDVVKEGQILCIIEAMKLMNEIEAQTSGRIVKILVDNGQPVEYGQPLFLLEPLR